MVNLQEYITEKFRINSSSRPTIKPKNRRELRDIIKSRSKQSNNSSTLDLNDIDVSEISSFIGIFSDVILQDVKLGYWRFSDKCYSIAGMFANQTRLRSIDDLSNWNVDGISNMSSLFSNCEMLREVKGIDKWNVENVKTMSSMFNNCKLLEDLGDLSHWPILNIEDMTGMFNGCKRLTDIGDINNWENVNPTILEQNVFTGNMFNDCNTKLYPEWYIKKHNLRYYK